MLQSKNKRSRLPDSLFVRIINKALLSRQVLAPKVKAWADPVNIQMVIKVLLN